MTLCSIEMAHVRDLSWAFLVVVNFGFFNTRKLNS
jgi:hypothetical protein